MIRDKNRYKNIFRFMSIYIIITLQRPIMGINHAGNGEKKQQFVNFTSDNWELQPQTTRRVEYG